MRVKAVSGLTGVDMKSEIAVLTAIAACLFAQQPNQPVQFRAVGDIHVTHQLEFIPTWSGNALLSIEGNLSASPRIWVFDGEGRQLAQIVVNISNANSVEVRAAAHGLDGMTGLCGAANDAEGHRAGFIALASADGALKSVIRTEPYSPTAIAIAPDGSIWTKGVEYLPIERKPSKTQNGILRHFDKSGKLMASFLPQSDFTPRELFAGVDQIAVGANRAGWSNGTGEGAYFEVVNGRVERYPMVKREATEAEKIPGVPMQSYQISGLTIATDDRTFVTSSVNTKNPILFTLDRPGREWHPVKLPEGGDPPLTNWLLGGSGNLLVFRTKQQPSWLRRVEVVSQ